MNRQRPPTSHVAAVGLLIVTVLAGCGRQQPTKVGPNDVKIKETAEDTFTAASKFLKQAAELTHYRDGLLLVNDYLHKVGLNEDVKEPMVRELKEKERDFLRATFALDEANLKYVGESTFQQIDAHHLQASFLFRDAARSLKVAGLSQEEQAAHALRWVGRHVLPHEQGDDNLPPLFVLKRGYGSARDRALVFLELIRQMDVEGCLIELETADGPDLLLAAVLFPGDGEPRLNLFDPRLAQPVLGPGGKGLASWNDVRDDPALLRPHGVESPSVEKARLRLTDSLGGLAPRMRFLEKRLTAYARISLYQDAARQARQFEEKTGLRVVPWDKAVPANVVPPAHLLARFLPTQEGAAAAGRDRLSYFWERQYPRGEIRGRLFQMDIVVPEVHPAAIQRLEELALNLFSNFLIQPREMLLRGKPDDAIKRLSRILTAMDEFDQREPDAAKFSAELAKWRTHVNDAYARAQTRKGAELVVWNEDRYLNTLLDLDESIPRMSAKEGETLTLTFILLRATRRSLGEETYFLLGQCLQDNAERQQAALDAARKTGKPAEVASKDARTAWNGAQGEWRSFNERYPAGPAAIADKRILVVKFWEAGDQEGCRYLLERLFLDLHESVHGRYHQSLARLHLGQTKLAQEQWGQLRDDVNAILEDDMFRDLVLRFQKEADRTFARNFELLARDWQQRGSWATWRDVLQADPMTALEKRKLAGK